MKKHRSALTLSALLCATTYSVLSQSLVSDDYQRGYLKDGVKYSVWEYYDAEKNLELKIDHTTGNVLFRQPDTSSFVIFKDGNWTQRRLEQYPIPIDGYNSFYRKLFMNFREPITGTGQPDEGTVSVMFDVDTTGVPHDYILFNDMDAAFGEALIRAMKEIESPWVPAQIHQTKYPSRFIMSLSFIPDPDKRILHHPGLPLARQLNLYVTTTYSLSIKNVEIHRSDRRFSVDDAHYIAMDSLEQAIHSGKRVGFLKFIGGGLERLPASIGNLSDLQYLNLVDNELTELPSEIAGLKKLQYLLLTGNQLNSLPSGLATLRQLSVLGLASNDFSEFPTILCACTGLEDLDLSNNRIAEIPPCISGLRNLRVIYLSQNHLKTLPEEVFHLKNLRRIVLDGNPLDAKIAERLQKSGLQKYWLR
ncbi:MAG TPA: leucine-rich repeat domain-containing protein [Chryseosolibacter sp.]